MQNDPSTPSAPPSRGFASLITLASDVSQELEAVEQAPAAPPPAVASPPQPVRIGPSPVAPPPQPQPAPSQWSAPEEDPLYSSVTGPTQADPDTSTPAWVYIVIGLVVVRVLSAC